MDPTPMRYPKVALINPGKAMRLAQIAPLSLGSLAAYLEKHGINVRIFDEPVGEDIESGLLAFAPDLVGITVLTPQASRAYEIARFCRERGWKTVLGGPHASVMPEEALEHADHVVVGEGEQALLDLAMHGREERIVPQGFVRSLDDLPRPAFHLMQTEFYAHTRQRHPFGLSFYFAPRSARLGYLNTSRGCPEQCTFCHNTWNRLPMRYHSPERVIDDIQYLIRAHRIDALVFVDDDFFRNRKRATEICQLLLDKDIKLLWACNARADELSPELLRLARQAGCRQLCLGLESGSQRTLDVLAKRMTVEQNAAAVALCHSAGLLSAANFIIGCPDERLEDIRLTERFIKENDLDCIGVSYCTPFPGTQLWKDCVARGLLRPPLRWDDYLLDQVSVQVSPYLTIPQLIAIRARLLRSFVLKPKVFAAFLGRSIREPRLALAKARAVLLPRAL